MDTVELNGEGFTPKASEGDRVFKGQLLLEYDKKAIQEKGYQLATPVVITNADEFQKISVLATGKVSVHKDIIQVES